MPALAVYLIENIIPPLMGLVIKHYERREDELDEIAKSKLDAHRDALQALKAQAK